MESVKGGEKALVKKTPVEKITTPSFRAVIERLDELNETLRSIERMLEALLRMREQKRRKV
jgi:hypothetical protein